MLLAFGDCVLDLERRELLRNGVVVHTRPKVFDVLSCLVENRDRVLSREELLTLGWPGLTVSDATLSSCILSVRRAVGDPKFIKTLRGQGFRFVAEVTQQGVSASAPARTGHARDENLSIAVLPFINLNGDTKFDYLADGLAEDITTELSRFKAFTVIARNSSFQYRGSANDVRKIGAELQVDYILEGSIRCAGDAFRATAQLIHAPTTRHIWAERYDDQVDRLFALQDDILQRIVANIAPEIALEEFRRASGAHTDDLRALEMAWRARALLDRGRTEADAKLYGQGMNLAEEAAALDPQCRHAWWTISFANFVLAFARAGDQLQTWLKRAREAAEKLRALDRNDHRAYLSLGWISYIERDLERALTDLTQAHELNPNCTMTLTMMGVVETSSGRAEVGYGHIDRAIRLSPRDLWLGFMFAAQAFACFALEKFEEGAELSRRAIQRDAHAPANHIILAACLTENGELDAAAAAIRTQRGIGGNLLQEYLERKRLPFKDEKLAMRFADALHAADAAAGQ